ncbi:DNRLRE domain-containing protein [Brevibacillus humidisoli]|uniref:DNRLRE domain-containing protein n=1 Tax=Brevibacillus humidisoli TaxID=2895522 RepID=UPI001E6240E5|nr:DNRLRE domain-containing protein [Brevibacillus humidisoli]UFJ40110.1 DNRLRE domain-containing protein [Brevibacillus humidisoli]
MSYTKKVTNILADTFVNAGNSGNTADTAFGATSPTINEIGRLNRAQYSYPFFKFDISGVNNLSGITDAKLVIPVTRAFAYLSYSAISAKVYRWKNEWNENTLTYNSSDLANYNFNRIDDGNVGTIITGDESVGSLVKLDILNSLLAAIGEGQNILNFYIHSEFGETGNSWAGIETGTKENTDVNKRPYLEITYSNQIPLLNVSLPTDNQTLSEGTAYDIEGSATDADNGNVVTVKYKINNGTERAIASGVSDGSTPLSFAKALTYQNKRLWDGATDVTGVDLAENTAHTLHVWVEDDQGGVSTEEVRNFTVIWNRPPTISGANEDLGTIMAPPVRTYTVTDPEGNPFMITEKINGTVIRSFPGVTGQEETVTIPHDRWIRLDLDTPHELTVEATDDNGLTSTRTFTFVRTETHIEFMLDFDNPDVEVHFTLDGMPKRVLVKLERYLPPGSEIEFVRVTNNAMDAEPTWEDATAAVIAGRGHLFTNETKTAESWRINIWVSIAKGTATERVLLNGYGGAFD